MGKGAGNQLLCISLLAPEAGWPLEVPSGTGKWEGRDGEKVESTLVKQFLAIWLLTL